MTRRIDARTISLGPEAARHTESLRALALAVGEPGRRGNGSISQLLILLARLMAAAPDELAAAIAAVRVAALDPMVRAADGSISAVRLTTDSGELLTLADAAGANAAEFAEFAAALGGNVS